MADSYSVVDGPCAGQIVRGSGIPYYRFPIPDDVKTAYAYPDISTASVRYRYWLYRLERTRYGGVYRYVGIEENGLPQDSMLATMRDLQDSLRELEKVWTAYLRAMFPFVSGRNVGPDYGLPEECGGLGLSSGKSLDDENPSLRVGWRWWLVKDGQLTGVIYKTPWPAKGPLQAAHMPIDKAPIDHELWSPAMGCACGIYAREVPSGVHESSLGGSHYALGVAVGWGKVIQHTDGWRAQYARPLCIVKPRKGDPVLELVAKNYGVPYITLNQAFKMGGEFTA